MIEAPIYLTISPISTEGGNNTHLLVGSIDTGDCLVSEKSSKGDQVRKEEAQLPANSSSSVVL